MVAHVWDSQKRSVDTDVRTALPDSPPATLPVLFIGGIHDPTSLPRMVEDSRRFIPQLEAEILEDGHWLMIGDEKDKVTATLATWLQKVTSTAAKRKSLL